MRKKKLLQNTLFAAMTAWALYLVQAQFEVSEGTNASAAAYMWAQR